jgi:hypothetical protein
MQILPDLQTCCAETSLLHPPDLLLHPGPWLARRPMRRTRIAASAVPSLRSTYRIARNRSFFAFVLALFEEDLDG